MMTTRVLALTAFMLSLSSIAAAAPPVEKCHDVDSCVARCKAGTVLACVRAGELYNELGQSERKETVTLKIDTALAKACDKGNAQACFVGGELHCNAAAADGKGGYGNCDATANSRFQKGCTAGSGSSCAYVGMFSHLGIGGENKDAARAKQFFDKAWQLLDDSCNAGTTADCFAFGLYRGSDRFGAKDDKASLDGLRRAVPLLSRDCDAGDGRSCHFLILLYTNGLAVTANTERAAAARKRLCKLAAKAVSCVAAPTPIGNTTTPPPTGKSGAKVPTVSIGDAAAAGNLDKEIIRKYIRTKLSDVTYCYEKELLRKPGLEGKVTVKFTIETTGAVSEATGSGLDPAVDSCVAGVVKKIAFPKPTGGGKVTVTYPFIFRSQPPNDSAH